MSKEKVLFLSVEITTRELDSKILIALEAARKGFTVVLGSTHVLRLAEILKCGIVFYKDASAPMESVFKKLKSYRVPVIVHDEEGFVHLNEQTYVNARLRFNTIKFIDTFFAWGSHQASLIKHVLTEFNSQSKVAAVGHPRIDFLREPFIKTTSPVDEKIILINTKLAEYNHRMGDDGWISILDSQSAIRNDAERNLRLEQKEYKKALFFKYQELVTTLSKEFSNYKIIIRPHPVENKQVWLDFCKELKNVEVIWSGTIAEWIAKSEVIIHTGCTTGLEAAITGKPVLTYKPIADKRFDIKLPDSVSTAASTTSEVISFIRTREKQKTYSEVFEALSPHVNNLQGRYAYEDIVEHIEDIRPVKVKNIARLLPILKVYFVLRDSLVKIKRLGHLEKTDPKFVTSIDEILDKKDSFLNLMRRPDVSIQVTQFSHEVYIFRALENNNAKAAVKA